VTKLTAGHPGQADLHAVSQAHSLWYSPHRHMGWRAFMPRKALAHGQPVAAMATHRAAAKNELK